MGLMRMSMNYCLIEGKKKVDKWMQVLQQTKILHLQVFFSTPLTIFKLKSGFFHFPWFSNSAMLLHCGDSFWTNFWNGNSLTLPAQLTSDWGVLKQKYFFFLFLAMLFAKSIFPTRHLSGLQPEAQETHTPLPDMLWIAFSFVFLYKYT